MSSRTRPSDLLGVAVFVAVAAWLLVRVLYGVLPPVPLGAGAGLVLLAGAEVVLAVVLRRRIERRAGARVLDPLLAARSVALAKASALVGATTAGAWVGLGLHLLGNQGLAAARSDGPGAVLGLFGSVLLVGAALVLEHHLRTPEPPPDGRRTPLLG